MNSRIQMSEEPQICPYTGLRSFTEEESLYFKGRDEHIVQATEQLQRQKFLMLTGASGDGKSSLVYAGIIPNARAGFLKSRYTQWCLADFRPERTPLQNLIRAVGKQLDISNPATVEAELRHGFSALVDLYKNSRRYIDSESNQWKNADEAERASLKRDAANLIVLVDQFEEFFTNPENYHRGVPSGDSNLVLNVLLETARIALEEDLPIYIVFTMRSDYIGQCAAFRSLPEYIGFSQFFVPRLNRSQLQQVIEEPATLSGNKITRRLTERLIHDIAEGVDQLPILQHALNQIWHAADNGKEEMDLIHYAMVGGMPAGELPDEQVDRFSQWFSKQPEKIRQFYREPNLQNVLDTHANKLYESAGETYRNKSGKELSDLTAKGIIKYTFTCLTKIDQSRAVRNRMTLHEIYNILNRKDIDIETVGLVLSIFREPGNTFIRPFITEAPDSNKLREDDVLDITHESLIRNWEYLETWAKEEFDNYSISLDFDKQLDRWIESNKSGGFLLSIGPLTYFESWYNKVKPNTWWIARYLPEDVHQDKKLEKAEILLDNAQEFIKLSARKHIATRTIMHYGPKRIAAVLAIIGFLTLSSFVVRNYLQQQNTYVLKAIKEQTFELANSTKVNFFTNSTLLAEQLKWGNITIDEIVAHVKDSITRINVVRRLGSLLIFQGRNEPKKEISECLAATDKLLREYPIQHADAKKLADLLKEINYFRVTAGLGYVYNPTDQGDQLRKRNAERSAAVVNHVLNTQPQAFRDISGLNLAIENAINYRAFSQEDLQHLLSILSPFENPGRSDWVKNNYAEDKLVVRGRLDYGFKFNGLFQELAYLYAATGNTERTLQCIDSLLKHSQNYYQNDYTGMADNATNVAGVFYTYGQKQSFDSFVKGYCDRKKIKEKEFYERLIGRSNLGVATAFSLNENGDITNLNLELGDPKQLEFFFLQYRECIKKTAASADERGFYLGLSYKDEAILRSAALKLSGITESKETVYPLLDQAFKYYGTVNKAFLAQPFIGEESEMTLSGPRRILFVYPDYATSFMPFEGRGIYYPFNSGIFIQYILEKNLFDELYTDAELPYISRWLQNYFVNMAFRSVTVRMRADEEILASLERKLAERKASQYADLNVLLILLANEAYEKGDGEKAVQYYSKLDFSKIMNLLRNTGPLAIPVNGQSFRMIATAVTGLVRYDHFNEAYGLVKIFKNPINRSSLYAFAAREMLEQRVNSSGTQQAIDSARIELTRIENLSTGQPNRQLIAHVLVMQDPEKNAPEAYRTIKNIFNKFDPTLRISRSFAFHGDLFGARQQITGNISDGDQAQFLWNILYGYSQGKNENKMDWQQYSEIEKFNNRFIDYVTEEN